MMNVDKALADITVALSHIKAAHLAPGTVIALRGLAGLAIALIAVNHNLNRSPFHKLTFRL